MSPALACRFFTTEPPGMCLIHSDFKKYGGIPYSCQVPVGP